MSSDSLAHSLPRFLEIVKVCIAIDGVIAAFVFRFLYIWSRFDSGTRIMNLER